jgi:protein gp37
LTRRFPKAFPNGFDVTLHPERLDEPKHVKKPSMFFVCSMADLFHKDVPLEYIDRPGVGRKGLWESNPFVVVYEFKLVK